MVRNAQTPILEFLDIAVHEVGHKLFSPFGELIMLIMGTGIQVLFPLVVGVVFAVWKHNLIAWGICWAWAANAMCDGARYIYDAPRGELMLLGGGDGLGDWSRILGPEHFDKLYLADRLRRSVRTLGIVTWFAAVGLIVFALVRNMQESRRAAATERRPRDRQAVGRADAGRESTCGVADRTFRILAFRFPASAPAATLGPWPVDLGRSSSEGDLGGCAGRARLRLHVCDTPRRHAAGDSAVRRHHGGDGSEPALGIFAFGFVMLSFLLAYPAIRVIVIAASSPSDGRRERSWRP